MGQSTLDSVHPDHLLVRTIEAGCLELHLRVGQPPYTDICDGQASDVLSEYEELQYIHVQQMVYALLTDEQIRHLESAGELTFPYKLPRKAIFDVHVLYSRQSIEADFAARTGS
jgi:Tfp pilus assembly pilus retraction ATPase PilT